MKALSPRPADARGFLLIGVLLFLSLLTVLVVASVMIAQVERHAASNGNSNLLAQQNALFALNTALGQLQREAGPDQRVTARADILNTTPAPGSANGATAYWTGVWKTYNPAGGINQQLDIGTTPLRTWSTTTVGPHWLISLPSNALTLTPAATLTTPTATVSVGAGSVTLNTITVANVGSAGTAYPVNVPLVPMLTTRTLNNATKQVKTGQYGYWVSDEGVKAKANLIDPHINNAAFTPSTYLVDSQRQFLAPAANAVYKILPTPFSATDTTTDMRGNTTYLARVSSPMSLQYMPSGTSASGWTTSMVNQNLADITTTSMGVLADVRKGGLKTDLTAAFENGLYTSNTANTSPTASSWFNALFPSAGTVTGAFTGTYDTQYVYRNYSGTAPGTTPNYGQTVAVNDSVSTNASYNGQFGTGGPFYDGLPWQTLYDYYNLYKPSIPLLQKKTSITASTQFTSTNPSSMPYAGTALDYLTGLYPSSVNAVILPMTPVILGFRMDYSVQPVAPASAGGTWTATLQTYPQVLLWNPFSVPLIPPSNFSYNLGTAAFRLNAVNMWVYPKGTALTTLTAANVAAQFPLNDNSGGRANFSTLPDTNSTPLQPGEIRVYSYSSSTPYSVGDISWAANPNGNAHGSRLVNYPQVTAYFPIPTPADEPTSVIANSPSGDCGQSGTINLGTKDTAGNTIDANNDYFHVSMGTYAESGPITNPSNDSINTTFNAYFGGGGYMTQTNAAWPVAPAARVGMSSSIMANISAPTWTEQPIGAYATAGPYRLIDFEWRVKGLKSSGDTTWQGYNQMAPLFMGNSATGNLLNCDDFGSGNYQDVYAGGFNAVSGASTKFIENPNASNTQNDSVWGLYSAGESQNVTAGGTATDSVVLYDVPNQPMVSLGQFMHTPVYLYNTPASFAELPGATMFIGGSLACPEVPLNQTGNIFCYSNLVNNRLMLDHSFLANQALFDSYFLSTVPPSGGFAFGTTPAGIYTSLSGNFNATYIQNNNPLPNGRMRYYLDNGAAATATTVSNLQNPYLAAANLMVDGAFNVNSTSVPAWIALLSSLSNNQLQLWNATSAATVSYSASTLKNPIPRFWSGTSGATGGPWDGTHPLTDTQVKMLATEIVAQVKLRGPFLSMADFLNRRLYNGVPTVTTGSIGSLYTSGALQAAIDTDVSGINTTALSYGTALTTSNLFSIPNGRSRQAMLSQASQLTTPYPLPLLTTIVSSTAVGIPAYLMQQDIVQAFAPVMTVRSDTFVIRCYGEADNPSTGAVEGRAWGEAVVQRLPDFIDQTDPALSAAPSTSHTLVPPIKVAIGNATPLYDSTGAAILNATNQTFGRRFKVVSFHWLNSNDL